MHATILCAEDTDVVRLLVCHLLRGDGHAVVEAANGLEALGKLDATIDCVVTDLLMPAMDGLELIETIRADGRFRRLPIVVLTAHNDPDLLQQAERAGADYIVEKPSDPDTLLSTVATALAKGRDAAETVTHCASPHAA
jgi:two-component system chemotaxis response regulator CheY